MKRLLAALLAVVLFGSVFAAYIPMTVAADSLYIRKIVSVVYDDSGSMKNYGSSNWAYASYAMQAFCGLLNSDDQLYITYMSEAEKNPNLNPPEIDLSASAIQSSVDSIRKHTAASNTPYNALDIAFNKLASVQDPDVNTQYWLVVITDGEFQSSSGGIVSEGELNSKLTSYASTVMPNNSTPRITYLAIGKNVTKPENKPDRGIFAYESSGAGDIVNVMAQIADKISGRSRLSAGDIVKKDGNVIEITSAVPLMNIAVLSQKTSAKIVKASYRGGGELNVSRAVSISYPERPGWTTDKTLNGTAFLINSPSTNIDAGTYAIQFSSDVSLSDVVVMFEPALEMRMTVSVNGRTLSDLQELQGSSEGDEISISCKICEMGTDREISPDLLPAGTSFEISISEDGKVVKQKSGKELVLSDYVLKLVETEIKASLVLPGFNPIDSSVKFTPTKYVPKIVYTMTAEYGGNVKSVKFDDIASNEDLSIVYTVYTDGVAMTDPEAVKALNPTVSLSPQGNDGTVTYTKDGKVVFTPKSASASSSDEGSFKVEVTCTLADGTKATEAYTVLLSEYRVIPVGTDQKIKKTEFYGNKVSVSFYITKDGVRLDKSAVEKDISVLFNAAHRDLLSAVEVSADGTITVTPYSEKDDSLTFWSWWINWARYFGLNGSDLSVTLTHAYGSADTTVDVVGEDFAYQLLNVYLPLALELTALTLLILWVFLVVTKPRYLKSAVLYVGEIKYNRDRGTHTLRNFSAVRLEKFNKVKRGNGRLKFKKKADIVTANGIKIRADHGGRILCEMLFPWYKGKVEPVDTDFANLRTPDEVADYIVKHKKLEINEFATTETIEGDYARSLAPANPRIAKYIVVPDSGDGVAVVEGKKVIKSGKLFIYING